MCTLIPIIPRNELKSKARHEKMTKKVMLSCDLRDLAVDCVTFGQMGKCFFAMS